MKNIDWAKLVVAIMDRLIISQAELAKRCKVAQQTVSTWKKGTRTPSVYARRQLMKFAGEAGLNLIFFAQSPRYVSEGEAEDIRPSGISPPVLEFANFLQQLPQTVREEVIEFARFKLDTYRRHGSDTDRR